MGTRARTCPDCGRILFPDKRTGKLPRHALPGPTPGPHARGDSTYTPLPASRFAMTWCTPSKDT